MSYVDQLTHTKPHIMKVVGNGWACMSATPGAMHEGNGQTPAQAYAAWCEKHDAHRRAVIRGHTAELWQSVARRVWA